MTHTVYVELALPRPLWDACGDAYRAQEALRLLGVWPTAPVTQARWRFDHARGGYIAELEVQVDLGQGGTP